MADGVKISSLAEATDAQMTDAGLVETAVADTGSSTGFSSKKASFGRLAGYILNKFSGLSLAGASQTVKAAIDKVFTNSYMDVGTTIESATNLNTITTVGKYSARTTTVSSLLNCPTATGFSMYVEVFTTSGKKQTIIDNNGATYTRINISNNTTSWTDWAKQPTASDLTASIAYVTTSSVILRDAASSSGTQVVTIPSGAVVYIISGLNTGWVHLVYDNGAVQYIGYASSSYISEATSATKILPAIGELSTLTTTAKTNLVAAVNEVNAAINSLVDGNEVSY